MEEFNLAEIEEKLASMVPEKLDGMSPERIRETIEQAHECFLKVFELKDHISSLVQSMRNLVEDYGKQVTLPAEFGLVVGLSIFGEDNIDFCIGHKKGVDTAIQNLIKVREEG